MNIHFTDDDVTTQCMSTENDQKKHKVQQKSGYDFIAPDALHQTKKR